MLNRPIILGLVVSTALSLNLQGCTGTKGESILEPIYGAMRDNPEVTCGIGSVFTGGAVWAVCSYGLGVDQTACIIGAVAAAAADGLVCYWNLSQKLIQDYDQTQQTIGYNPSQGYVVQILDFSATPKIVKPGEKVMINARFALMSPNRNEEISFERIITLPGDKKPRVQRMTYQPGTWGSDSVPFEIDSKTPDGKVELTLEVSLLTQKKTDRRTLCFNISNSGQVSAVDLCPAYSSGPVAPKLSGWLVIPKAKKPLRLREKPDSKSRYTINAPTGYKYPILEKSEQGKRTWYLIKLENEEKGWIQSTSGKFEAAQ